MDQAAEQVFRDFVAGRAAALLRTAYLLVGDRHRAEDLLQTVHRGRHPAGGAAGGAPPPGRRRRRGRDDRRAGRRRRVRGDTAAGRGRTGAGGAVAARHAGPRAVALTDRRTRHGRRAADRLATDYTSDVLRYVRCDTSGECEPVAMPPALGPDAQLVRVVGR